MIPSIKHDFVVCRIKGPFKNLKDVLAVNL